MPTRTGNIHTLRQRVVESAKRPTAHLVGSELSEAGVLDRAVLNRELGSILDGLADQADLAPRIERSIQAFLRAVQTDNTARTAKHVCGLLSLELDDLRKAALLSLMVRLAGKRKFDPIAAYILQNQKVLVTRPG